LMFLIKAVFFPGFSAFAANFSGDNWSHVTLENLQQRLLKFVSNRRALGAIVPALLLGILVSWRYVVFPVLMAPLILLHLLALREFLYQFDLYYALPFLVVWSGLLVVATYRAAHGTLRFIEPTVLLASAILSSAPVLDSILPNVSNSFPTIKQAVGSPVADLTMLSAIASDMARNEPDLCVSTAVAALAPNSFTPEQVLDPDFNVNRCRTVILYNVDPHYRPLIWHLVYWNRRPPVLGRFLRYDNPGVPTS